MSYCNDALVSVSGTAQRKTFLQIGRDGFFKQKVIPFFHRRDSMPDMLAVLCGNDGHIAQARRFQQSFHAFITAFFGKAESLPRGCALGRVRVCNGYNAYFVGIAARVGSVHLIAPYAQSADNGGDRLFHHTPPFQIRQAEMHSVQE